MYFVLQYIVKVDTCEKRPLCAVHLINKAFFIDCVQTGKSMFFR